MKPATRRTGRAPRRSTTVSAMRRCRSQRSIARASRKPPRKRKISGLAYGAAASGDRRRRRAAGRAPAAAAPWRRSAAPRSSTRRPSADRRRRCASRRRRARPAAAPAARRRRARRPPSGRCGCASRRSPRPADVASAVLSSMMWFLPPPMYQPRRPEARVLLDLHRPKNHNRTILEDKLRCYHCCLPLPIFGVFSTRRQRERGEDPMSSSMTTLTRRVGAQVVVLFNDAFGDPMR